MPILGKIASALDIGVTLGTSTGGSAGTGGTTGSAGTSTPSTPSTPTVNGVTQVGLAISLWNIQLSETIYLNAAPEMGPTAWVPFIVRYVFGDGNAVLTRDPDNVAYTGFYVVGTNLRRKTEVYNSSYPGP